MNGTAFSSRRSASNFIFKTFDYYRWKFFPMVGIFIFHVEMPISRKSIFFWIIGVFFSSIHLFVGKFFPTIYVVFILISFLFIREQVPLIICSKLIYYFHETFQMDNFYLFQYPLRLFISTIVSKFKDEFLTTGTVGYYLCLWCGRTWHAITFRYFSIYQRIITQRRSQRNM